MLRFLMHFIGDDHLGAILALFKASTPGMLGYDGGSLQESHYISLGNFGGIFNGHGPAIGDVVFIAHHFGVLNAHQAQLGIAIRLHDVSSTGDLGHLRFTFRHAAGFKKLFHTRETGGDITASRHTTGMEGTQGKLRARLADGLSCDDANGRTHFDHLAAAQVHAIALGTDPMVQLTGKR